MKRIIDKLFVAAGTIVFLIYAAPLVALILNAGNIAGMGAGVLLILIGLFFDKIKLLNKKITCIFLVAVLICTSLFATTLLLVVNQTKSQALPNQALVVLGCKVDGEKASLQLYKRAMAGVEYMQANPDSKAVLCGGMGNGESISEAECIRRIMLDNGIDESRLLLEDKSTSTEENLQLARIILEDNNIPLDVAISTSDYHCYRAKLIARRLGINATTIPSYADRFSRPTFYTREVFGVWVQWLKMI